MKTIRLDGGFSEIRAGLDPDPEQGHVIELVSAGGMRVAVWLDEDDAEAIAAALLDKREAVEQRDIGQIQADRQAEVDTRVQALRKSGGPPPATVKALAGLLNELQQAGYVVHLGEDGIDADRGHEHGSVFLHASGHWVPVCR